ncbi:MAG TPA: YlxR family protein [Armatimonadota bacterium]|nr:YlxR family protein [Armatimonadota bacterium]
MPPRARKPVIRTCVVCHQPQPKMGLLRIVRTPLGEAQMDPTGKRAGRGAYVCSREECRTGPRAQKQLSRALGIPVESELLSSWFEGTS